jgi:hypothetical protein
VARVLLATLALVGDAGAEPRRSAEVVAGAWIEVREGAPALVVGLYRRIGTEGPAKAWVGCSVVRVEDGPGAYGTIAQDAFDELAPEPGVLVLASRALVGDERSRPPSVLVTATPPTASLPVRPMVVGELPDGAIHFAMPTLETQVALSRHVLEVGERAELVVAAPEASFFHEETLEVLVASRRLAIDGDDPGAAPGHVELVLVAPDREDPPVRELAGAAGERRIRGHFTDPACPWAERHVGWLSERWVVDLLRPAQLTFRVETDAVVRPGRVSELWRGRHALTLEAIHANGFGGSSSGLTLPPLLVVPKGTPRREVALRPTAAPGTPPRGPPLR